MQTICWPVIIKQQHSEELIYLASDRDWLEYCCLQPHIANSLDKLLDSAGATFDIVIEPQPLSVRSSQPASEPSASEPSASVQSTQVPSTQAPSTSTQSDQATADLPQLKESLQPIDLVSFIHYVREHAVLNGHCCSTKLVFSNIKQGIETVEYLESN
ncbi:DUF4144 domain-containing protein [Shewanella olleyana]|uniref:DUF4144 domain-containing protein n=1 Tax=Shewanella olleyana TaxID=135626 RepID=UPI00200DD348|nr:DUF4144 domain-containing protein [Shewanella olleyana]MCL1065985.1 DUF4144 domain-containing protein [Shewanella olleyana]